MTTTTLQPDRITAQEIRDLFAGMTEEIDELHERMVSMNNFMHTMREGLQQAATPPGHVGTFTQMEITSIIFNMDKNDKPVYMALGIPYPEFGVRIWDEVLPLLDLDPANFKAGRNAIKPPIVARVLLGETTNQKTGKVGIGPRKVTGKA